MASTTKKIQYLRNLIEHPRTGEAERDAAKRALERVLAKAGQSPKSEATRPSWYRERVYGAKYESMGGRYMTAAEIAKLIRADIKLALKAARATAEPGSLAVIDPLAAMPAEIKVTVKAETYSGGRSIDVVMRGVPEDWGFSMQEDRYSRKLRSMPSPALREAAQALKEILHAYNYDGSSPEVDHYDVNYYGHVVLPTGLLLA